MPAWTSGQLLPMDQWSDLEYNSFMCSVFPCLTYLPMEEGYARVAFRKLSHVSG